MYAGDPRTTVAAAVSVVILLIVMASVTLLVMIGVVYFRYVATMHSYEMTNKFYSKQEMVSYSDS